MQVLGRAISKNSLMLGLFAIVSTAAIAATYLGTRDAIIAQERAARARALLEIVPQSRHDNIMLDDVVPVDDREWLSLSRGGNIHVALSDGVPVAFIIPSVAPDGYSGAIKLITGINSDGSIAGVRVLSHNETPGLGDKIDLKKSDWVLGFDGKSLLDPLPEKWKVKKDRGEFDQLTGATITPRAVTKAVYQSLLYYKANSKTLLQYRSPALGEEDGEEDDHG
jgi:electron transport complex protein RnfG